MQSSSLLGQTAKLCNDAALACDRLSKTAKQPVEYQLERRARQLRVKLRLAPRLIYVGGIDQRTIPRICSLALERRTAEPPSDESDDILLLSSSCAPYGGTFEFECTSSNAALITTVIETLGQMVQVLTLQSRKFSCNCLREWCRFKGTSLYTSLVAALAAAKNVFTFNDLTRPL